MEDERLWSFEESLWTATPEHYHECIDDHCLMALPHKPFIFTGEQCKDAVSSTPRWSKVALTDRQVARPQEGIIVIAYSAKAERDGVEPYMAYCTSVYRRLEHEVWRVIQHSQLPPLMSGASETA